MFLRNIIIIIKSRKRILYGLQPFMHVLVLHLLTAYYFWHPINIDKISPILSFSSTLPQNCSFNVHIIKRILYKLYIFLHYLSILL